MITYAGWREAWDKLVEDTLLAWETQDLPVIYHANQRLRAARARNDLEEQIYECTLCIMHLGAQDLKKHSELLRRWNTLDTIYHTRFCQRCLTYGNPEEVPMA